MRGGREVPFFYYSVSFYGQHSRYPPLTLPTCLPLFHLFNFSAWHWPGLSLLCEHVRHIDIEPRFNDSRFRSDGQKALALYAPKYATIKDFS